MNRDRPPKLIAVSFLTPPHPLRLLRLSNSLLIRLASLLHVVAMLHLVYITIVCHAIPATVSVIAPTIVAL